MDVTEAVRTAITYVQDVYASGGETISHLGLEEFEYDEAHERWMIGVSFSRPWNTPRTRTAELFETMGAAPPALKRSFKVLTLHKDGQVLSMKNRPRSDYE